jgi:hypothetical protein
LRGEHPLIYHHVEFTPASVATPEAAVQDHWRVQKDF